MPMPSIVIWLPVTPSEKRSKIFLAPAPAMIGADRKKEKCAALSRCMPRNSAAVMVTPERETPGMIAKACADPTTRASLQETTVEVFLSPPCPFCRDQDQGEDDQRTTNDKGAAQVGFDHLFGQESGKCARDSGGRDQPDHAGVRIISMALKEAGSGLNERNPVLPEIPEHGQQSAGVERHVEGKTLSFPAQEPGYEDQVSRTADRQEFRDSLNHAKNDCFEYVHPRRVKFP